MAANQKMAMNRARSLQSSPSSLPSLAQFLRNRWIIFAIGVLVGVVFTVPVTMMISDEHHEASHPSSLLQQQPLQQQQLRIKSKPEQQQQPVAPPARMASVSAAIPPVMENENEDESRPVIDFELQPGVVIVTKIHGPGKEIYQLVQSMCLLKAAYNYRPRYPVIIFVSEPLNQQDQRDLRMAVHPAPLHIAVDKLTLKDHLDDMTDEQRKDLIQRCNVTSVDELFWWSRCLESGSRGTAPLSYTWQAEFRSLHVWTHEALQSYKYMFWMDSDAFCTQPWDRDPIAYMVRNKLTILFNHFPQGTSHGEGLREKMDLAYQQPTFCGVHLKDGHLEVEYKDPCPNPRVHQIHGFFHITDLDFFRSQVNLNWSRIMIGDGKFSRRWDDQLAVTIPAAMLAPNTSWDMHSHNFSLQMYHNSFLDGRVRWRYTGKTKAGGGFRTWWTDYSETHFPAGRQACQSWIRSGG